MQIGSALASSLGQWVKMPENRLRVPAARACGGIAATFNAPITGVFFGVEIILREFSVDALFTVMLSAMVADVIGREFLGSAPFLSGFPPGIDLHHARTYLLVAVLAVIAGLIGLAFSKVVYLVEDLCDRLWQGRPEWARPAVGGLALGLLLLAIPQMYGVGYPVMYKTVAGGYVLWFLLLLAAAKIAATSLSLGIGGSGGIFAPSLFIGVTSGYAFGDIVDHLFGAGAGQPALYAVVAMGAVFTAAARAPLTSLASVVEMTGNFALTLPVMLAVAIASTVSRALSYGTIYTTKLLRRGTDIDRTAPWRVLQDMKVAGAMRRFRPALDVPPAGGGTAPDWAALAGPVTHRLDPQSVFATESLAQTLRQLEAYGRDGLPVLSADGHEVEGWVTNTSVLRAIAQQISGARPVGAPGTADGDGPAARPAARIRAHRGHRQRRLARRRRPAGHRGLAAGQHSGLGAARPQLPGGQALADPAPRRPDQPARPRATRAAGRAVRRASRAARPRQDASRVVTPRRTMTPCCPPAWRPAAWRRPRSSPWPRAWQPAARKARRSSSDPAHPGPARPLARRRHARRAVRGDLRRPHPSVRYSSNRAARTSRSLPASGAR